MNPKSICCTIFSYPPRLGLILRNFMIDRWYLFIYTVKRLKWTLLGSSGSKIQESSCLLCWQFPLVSTSHGSWLLPGLRSVVGSSRVREGRRWAFPDARKRRRSMERVREEPQSDAGLRVIALRWDFRRSPLLHGRTLHHCDLFFGFIRVVRTTSWLYSHPSFSAFSLYFQPVTPVCWESF